MSPDNEAPPRADERAADAIRQVVFRPGWLSAPAGSVLAQQGDTWVLCTVTIENRVPRWRRGAGAGWLTATYNMLPGSTNERTARERRGARGRTQEIERLIARALRGAVDLSRLGDQTVHVDCDVLQADGGTRTASVTAGWLAVTLAARDLVESGDVRDGFVTRQLAAVSVGVVDGVALLDLDYREDVRAETDMNVVMTSDGDFVEIQGTAEGAPFTSPQLEQMLELARAGNRDLVALQAEVLNDR